MNVKVLNFFNKYLKGKQNIDLVNQAETFSEIEAVANLK